MKSNTALVTAFFDINRSKFKTSKLDNSKYFEYFKFVAHLQNDLFMDALSKSEDNALIA